MAEPKERDFWRDTWVRYLGYANEVGESFRPIVPNKVVRASYAVAVLYTFADCGDKGWKMYKKDGRLRSVAVETTDALIWQTLASVAIPGFVINRICAYSHRGLAKYTKAPMGARNWITVGIGLLSIPFIVHPIDDGTTWFMNKTFRKWAQENIMTQNEPNISAISILMWPALFYVVELCGRGIGPEIQAFEAFATAVRTLILSAIEVNLCAMIYRK